MLRAELTLPPPLVPLLLVLLCWAAFALSPCPRRFFCFLLSVLRRLLPPPRTVIELGLLLPLS